MAEHTSYASNPSNSSPCGGEAGNNGNIAYIADFLNFNWTQSFTYDGLNRLTSAFRSDGGYNHTYNYDSFGNLLIQDNLNSNPSYTINSATNQLVRWNATTNLYDLYRYDAAGNLTSSDTSMGTGTSSIGGHSYTYNAQSQITSVDGGATASYLYNGMDERSYKQTSTDTTDYIYLNGQPMSERSATYGPWQDYIYANGQKIVRVASPAFGGTSVPSYYLDDHLGTTQVELDASGNVTWQGQFTPFGAELPDGTTAMHYKFTGKERDAESGLDYFGARYYASTTGRWVSPDWAEKPEAVPYSKLDDPQSLNLYNYVINNPLSKADADGHCFEDACVIEGGAAVVTLYAIGALAVTEGAAAYFNTPSGQRSLGTFTNGVSASASHSVSTIKGWFTKGDKAPPNPHGQKGAPDHQQGVKDAADEHQADAKPGETVLQGQKIQGVDSTRRPDVQTVDANGRTRRITEVERRPNSKRHRIRKEEYDSHGIPHETKPPVMPH